MCSALQKPPEPCPFGVLGKHIYYIGIINYITDHGGST
jgi:hypothetical protein